ncbi:MAG: ATP-binding protein [Chloroflexota bacterium]
MAQTEQVQLSFQADIKYLGLAAAVVQELCELTPGLSLSAVYNIQLAVDEALVNIIEHAYGGRPGGVVEMSGEIQRDRLVITLCDRGASFDPTQVPLPDPSAPRAHGFGMYLMRKLMDEVSYTREPSGRNCVRLIKVVG